MSHRVEPYPTSRRASPGPDARRSPPPPPSLPGHPHPHGPPHGHHYAYEMPRDYPAGYMYGPPPPHAYGHDSRYAAYAPPPHPQPFPMQHAPQGYMPYPLAPQGGPTMAGPDNGGGGGGGGPQIQVVHTDDAGTKLSNSVRRRCFNCCTTETSTWRRSNLSPGKVLCNKCGLFERTHSRPRPEQFPHKRGPLAASTLRARSPQGATNAQPAYYAPPVSISAPPAHHDTHSSPYTANFAPAPAPPPHPNPNSHPSAPSSHQNQNGVISHPGTPKLDAPSRTHTPIGSGSANGNDSPPPPASADKAAAAKEREMRARKRRGEDAEDEAEEGKENGEEKGSGEE